MTTPSTAPDAVRPEQNITADVERLAEFVGMTRHRGNDWMHPASGTLMEVPEAWNPLWYAEDDYEVLERAREVWARDSNWHRFVGAYARIVAAPMQPTLTVVLQRHECGMYSRAVLAVLRSTETRG